LRVKRSYSTLATKKFMISQRPEVELLATHTPELFAMAVRRAANLLRAGEVVALPTETVYGLAADALNARAVARIYEIKCRPARNPVIVHVASLEMARHCVAEWPGLADKLARAFWPGPLTLVLPKSPVIPEIVTAGGPTVGVRWPAHPFIQAVIREFGFPLAAPSANLANRLSPTKPDHVRQQLGDRIQLIVDGGQAQVGIESTVLDLTALPPRILRPGMIHQASLAAVVDTVAGPGTSAEAATLPLASPGLSPKHYAPRARLMVWRWNNEVELLEQVHRAESNLARSKLHVIAHTNIPSAGNFAGVSVIPHDAEAFARALYAELHRCDAAGAEWIVVESPPDDPAWAAIVDRLRRAASDVEAS
jgi:L-threonylcarbamoyladenylate synthase